MESQIATPVDFLSHTCVRNLILLKNSQFWEKLSYYAKRVSHFATPSQVPKRYPSLNDKTVLSYPHRNFLDHAISGKIYPKFIKIP